MKRKILRRYVLIAAAVLAAVLFIVLTVKSHSTYWKYNDWWIDNTPIDEVEERYGAFDLDDGKAGADGRVGYRIGRDDSGDLYYIMEYDPKSRVYDIYIGRE